MLDVTSLVGIVFSGMSALVIEDVDDEGGSVVVRARTKGAAVPCPGCGAESSRVHGYYERTAADVPAGGRRVVLKLRARRMRCPVLGCGVQTFREQVADVLERYQRRTVRLAGQVEAAVRALAGLIDPDGLKAAGPWSSSWGRAGPGGRANRRRRPADPPEHVARDPGRGTGPWLNDQHMGVPAAPSPGHAARCNVRFSGACRRCGSVLAACPRSLNSAAPLKPLLVPGCIRGTERRHSLYGIVNHWPGVPECDGTARVDESQD
jgi:hypothetical protein